MRKTAKKAQAPVVPLILVLLITTFFVLPGIVSAQATPAATGWGAPDVLATSRGEVSWHEVHVGPSGTTVVVWAANEPGQYSKYLWWTAAKPGGDFPDPQLVDTSEQPLLGASAYASGDRLLVVWQRSSKEVCRRDWVGGVFASEESCSAFSLGSYDEASGRFRGMLLPQETGVALDGSEVVVAKPGGMGKAKVSAMTIETGLEGLVHGIRAASDSPDSEEAVWARAVVAGDRVGALWAQKTGSSYDQFDLYWSERKEGRWSKGDRIAAFRGGLMASSRETLDTLLTVATNERGAILVGWGHHGPGGPKLQVVYRDPAAGWKPQETVPGATMVENLGPRAALDFDGRAALIWVADPETKEIRAVERGPAKAWSSPKPLGPSFPFPTAPVRLVAAGDGGVFAAWHAEAGQSLMFSQSLKGADWTTPLALKLESYMAPFDIAGGAGGHAAVAWIERIPDDAGETWVVRARRWAP